MAQELICFYERKFRPMMNELDKEINSLIMREVGFEIGPGNKIYDQDTGMPVRINGMDVIAPGGYVNRQRSMEFDPYNNIRMMNYVFNYYIGKQSEESGSEVVTYYNKEDSIDGGKIECRMDDNSLITSNKYKRDTLKYTDIIMQLNGEDNPDLARYDIPKEKKETIINKKSTTKRKI